MEKTTIQVSPELLKKLAIMKIHVKESYEDIIWDLVEDRMELSEQTKKDIAEAREDVRKGRVYSLAEVEKKLGL